MRWIRWWIWAIFERIERSVRLDFPMDCLNYPNFPRFIHGVKLAVPDSWMANQPRIKNIYFTVSTKTSPSLSPYINIHMTPSFWLHLILNHRLCAHVHVSMSRRFPAFDIMVSHVYWIIFWRNASLCTPDS